MTRAARDSGQRTRRSGQRGDENALFERHSHRLVRTVQRITGAPRHVAEDACQIAWIQLLRTQPEREAIFAWLKVVATREAIRILRVERSSPAVDPDGVELPLGLGEAADAERVVDAHGALELVAQLPLRQARMFGFHVAGLSYEEIADLTGDSRRTVERQLLRARATVRAQRQG